MADAPRFDTRGRAHVAAFVLPPSGLASEAARERQRWRGQVPADAAVSVEPDIAVRRAAVDAMLGPRVARVAELYPVDVREDRVGGVPVRVVTAAGTAPDPARLLVNLHGGAFHVGWASCSLIEAAPIAAATGLAVVSVDYRMAPEHHHPAGAEDVVAVIAGLRAARPGVRIALYGGSAGGLLTAQACARLVAEGHPQVAAAGIFGAGAVPFGTGDSAYIAGAIDGSFPAPPVDGPAPDITRGYFDGHDPAAADVSPGYHDDVLARFPPTLVVTGTRAMDLSPAVATHSALLRAGVAAALIVGEAMGHCYYYDPDLPESRDAYAAMAAFFLDHLRA